MSVFTNPASAAPEHAAAYTAAILELLGDRDPFDVLSATPELLARRLREVDPEEIRRPEAEGKWSVGEVLQHLADSDLVVRLSCADGAGPRPAAPVLHIRQIDRILGNLR